MTKKFKLEGESLEKVQKLHKETAEKLLSLDEDARKIKEGFWDAIREECGIDNRKGSFSLNMDNVDMGFAIITQDEHDDGGCDNPKGPIHGTVH